MLDRTGTKFSHVKPGDTPWKGGGLRDFFLLYDYSPDMEYLEIVGPADFGTVDVEGPCEVPVPHSWT